MDSNYQKNTVATYLQIYEKVSNLEILKHEDFESIMMFLSQNIEPIFKELVKISNL